MRATLESFMEASLGNPKCQVQVGLCWLSGLNLNHNGFWNLIAITGFGVWS